MANWSRDRVDASNLNNGQEYTIDSDVSVEQLNSMVNSGLYSQDFVEALTDTPEIDNSNPSSGFSIEFVDNIKNGKTYKKFKFNNIISTTDELNNKANKDLSNVTYPQLTPDGQVHTESGYTTYMTTNKMTWYIIHPTGKKECGMSYTDVNNDADTTLTMPISFSDTNFVCTFSAATQNVYATFRVEKLAVNKVRIRLGSSNNAVNKQPTTGCIKCEGI